MILLKCLVDKYTVKYVCFDEFKYYFTRFRPYLLLLFAICFSRSIEILGIRYLFVSIILKVVFPLDNRYYCHYCNLVPINYFYVFILF